MFQIEEELKKLPGKPGVYIMHGEKDEIIYVGKAVSLKNRVRQYFQSSRDKTAKIKQMVSKIARVLLQGLMIHDLSILSQIRNWKPWCWSVI